MLDPGDEVFPAVPLVAVNLEAAAQAGLRLTAAALQQADKAIP